MAMLDCPQSSAVGTPKDTRLWIVLILSSLGLMADVYDLFIINLIRPSLEEQFGNLSPRQDSMLTGAPLLGAVIGMVGFGYLADQVGRRIVFVATAATVAVGSLGSALAPATGIFGMSIYGVLVVFRFVLGIGVGGEYPLVAASIAENTSSGSSSKSFAMVLFGMAIGSILGPAMFMTFLGYDSNHHNAWRLCLGFGAALAALCAILRYMFLWETTSWQRCNAPVTYTQQLSALWAMRGSLLGTAGAWFLYDIVTYGVNMFSTTIFQASPGMASARIVLIINLCGTIPGIIIGFALSSSVRMRQLQILGLGAMLVCFTILGEKYHQREKFGVAYLSIFIIQRVFDGLGPNLSSFIIPGQIYPTRIRATAHGVSAAAGKLGAVVGTIVFPYLNAVMGVPAVMYFMSLVCALTVLWTIFFVPLYSNDKLEAIAGHDDDLLADQAVFAEQVLHTLDAGKGEATPLVLRGGKSDFP